MSDDRIQNYERQVHRLVKDPDGRDVLLRLLGLRVAPPEAGPSVVLLVPTLGNVKRDTEKAIEAMLHVSRAKGIRVPMTVVDGHSLLHWARNEMVAELYRKADFQWTHALFVDDDMVPPPGALAQMVSHGKDIVSALCTTRRYPPSLTIRNFDEETGHVRGRADFKRDTLMQVDCVGTGMVLISREAFDRVGEFYLSCGWERKLYGDSERMAEMEAKRRAQFADSSIDERWYKNGCWFQCLAAVSGRGEYGEDISFCLKARECGIPVYCDTSVQPFHIGDYAFGVDEFLEYKRSVVKVQEEEKRVVIVE